MTLKSLKPVEYETVPRTLGQHLLKVRKERGLLQREAAAQIGFTHTTYIGWERDIYHPYNRNWKQIIEYLGYYPIIGDINDLNPILGKRQQLGLTQSDISMRIGVPEDTYRRVEHGRLANGRHMSYREIIKRIEKMPF